MLKCPASDCLRTIFLFLLEQQLPVAVLMITAAKEEVDLVHISKVHIKKMLGIDGHVRQSLDFQETAVHVWCKSVHSLTAHTLADWLCLGQKLLG